MRAASDRQIQGFTLLELMIVVSIIGVLASVAIPSFLNYQLTSKRAEAFANLGALAKTQKSYFAEFNQFVAVAPEPGSTLGNVPDGTKRDVTGVRIGFSVIGFTVLALGPSSPKNSPGRSSLSKRLTSQS